MTAEHWDRIETLYHAMFELPPEDRESFLRQACAGDAELRSEVLSLVEADEGGVAFWNGGHRRPRPVW